eukprot:SAG31_NODE_1472_length_8208_cov_5.179800_2_plen_54_part_00
MDRVAGQRRQETFSLMWVTNFRKSNRRVLNFLAWEVNARLLVVVCVVVYTYCS